MQQVGLTGRVYADAEIPVELIPVQLNPAALETQAHARHDQTQKEQAEHGYAGRRELGSTVRS